jgi:cellulose synthase/poly-beta-1,6-N-acetylglucosamine synthase-like glycosyltransferase
MLKSSEGLALVLVVLFLCYLSAIVRSYFRGKPAASADVDAFGWHMFVPCRDEEAVIDQTIERLRTAFPVAHVWVIDDDSDDATADIVTGWADRDSFVHLVQRRRPFARTGKGDALNSAYYALNAYLAEQRPRPRPRRPAPRPRFVDRAATIVCVVDADGHMAANALQQVSGPAGFGSPRCGAAQITVRMRNRDERTPRPGRGRLANAFSRYLVRMQDIEFRTAIAAMQALRVRTRSVGLGGNGQFTRLSVLDEIARQAGQPWHGALLEDYELGVHVLLAGYENRYVDTTYVSQEGVTDLRRLLTQRTRWSQGNIQCVKYLPEIIRSRHFGSAAVVEAAYYLLLPFIQLIGMLIWPVVFVYAIHSTTVGADGFVGWLGNAWWFLSLMVLLGLVPFAMWGPIYRRKCEPQVSWWRSVMWGLGMCLYVYYLYVSVTRAFVRLALRRSGWAKTRRNSENLAIGVIAKEA